MRNHRDEELEGLVGLLFSPDESNFDLAMEILKGLAVDNWSIYIDLRKSAEYFSARRYGLRVDIRALLRIIHKANSLDLQARQLDYLPECLAVLAPIIKKVDLNSNKFTHIPAPILAYSQAEEMNLSMNNIAEIAPEFWQLRSLRTLKISNNRILRIGAEVQKAKILETLFIVGQTYTDLPDELTQLPNFQVLHWGGVNAVTEITAETLIKNIEKIAKCPHLRAIALFVPKQFRGHAALEQLQAAKPKAEIDFYFN
jgi:hypothetical protein